MSTMEKRKELHTAFEKNDFDKVHTLLEHGANIVSQVRNKNDFMNFDSVSSNTEFVIYKHIRYILM